jgi:hypothetical protein
MAARYKTAIGTPRGPRTCFEAVRQREGNLKPLVARFGGIPSNGKNTRPSTTASRARTLTSTKSWLPGSCGEGARCAGTATKCKYTTSPDSPIWHHPAPASPRGRNSWRRCDANPSWSADHAMTTSIPGSRQPSHDIGHQRAGCLEIGHVRFGGEKDPPTRAPRGAVYPTTGACLKSLGRATIACQSRGAVRRSSGPGAAGPGSGTGRHQLSGGCQVAGHD